MVLSALYTYPPRIHSQVSYPPPPFGSPVKRVSVHPWESNPRPTPFWCRLSVGASHAIPPLRAFPLTACLSVHYVPYMIFCRCHAAPHGAFARPFHTVPLRLMSVLCRSIVTLCISTAHSHPLPSQSATIQSHCTAASLITLPSHGLAQPNPALPLLNNVYRNKSMPLPYFAKLCHCFTARTETAPLLTKTLRHLRYAKLCRCIAEQHNTSPNRCCTAQTGALQHLTVAKHHCTVLHHCQTVPGSTTPLPYKTPLCFTVAIMQGLTFPCRLPAQR